MYTKDYSKQQKREINTKEDRLNLYEVEKILDKRNEKGVTYYLIKWEGYDDIHNSWEPESSIKDIKQPTLTKSSNITKSNKRRKSFSILSKNEEILNTASIDTNKSDNMKSKRYRCNACNYECVVPSRLKTHQGTKKHLLNIERKRESDSAKCVSLNQETSMEGNENPDEFAHLDIHITNPRPEKSKRMSLNSVDSKIESNSKLNIHVENQNKKRRKNSMNKVNNMTQIFVKDKSGEEAGVNAISMHKTIKPGIGDVKTKEKEADNTRRESLKQAIVEGRVCTKRGSSHSMHTNTRGYNEIFNNTLLKNTKDPTVEMTPSNRTVENQNDVQIISKEKTLAEDMIIREATEFVATLVQENGNGYASNSSILLAVILQILHSKRLGENVQLIYEKVKSSELHNDLFNKLMFKETSSAERENDRKLTDSLIWKMSLEN